jgi:serine/threonine protein kinase
MEYVDGQDLKKMIRTNAPFTVERTLNLGIQICAGLGYAHRAGLVHADVKPQNILITGNDHVKITDFGIAQALSHTQPLTKQSVVWGSPHYFSPEQASGEAPTPASDVYAIGIVLFEMLTGRLPYNGNDQQELALAHIREQVPHVRDLNPNVPANIDWIVGKVMSKEPSARYRTADQLGRILISYQKQLESPASPPPAEPAAPQASVSASPAPPPVTYQASYTPPPQQQPPQQRYTPLPRPASTGPMNRVSSGATPAEPARPVTGSYRPTDQPGYYPYPSDGTSGTRGGVPNYQYTSAPSSVDLATIVLGAIALMAVLGLIVLWLVVWNAYT